MQGKRRGFVVAGVRNDVRKNRRSYRHQVLKMWFECPGTLFLHNSQSARIPIEKDSLPLSDAKEPRGVLRGDCWPLRSSVSIARRPIIPPVVAVASSIASSSLIGVGSLLQRT